MDNTKTLTRRTTLKTLGAVTAASALTAACQPRAPSPRNIVMIVVDDLNDYVGFLGGYPGNSHTPRMDALAAASRSYTNAHACVPSCIPSRAAVLFGKGPETTGVFNRTGITSGPPDPESPFGKYNALLGDPSVLSLPQMVKTYAPADYMTMSMGKVFHSARPEQWDVQAPFREISELSKAYPSTSGDLFSYGPLKPGEIHQDQATADWASGILSGVHNRPLFLAIGFYQPHVPWRLPDWAFDLHPMDKVIVPDYRPDDLDDLPPGAKHLIKRPGALFSHLDLVRSKGTHANIVQAYLAAMSHTDKCVGDVINAIANGPNADTTDIILWSDHGYHLGEKLRLRKGTLWEQSTRVPLIIRSPDVMPGEVITDAVSLLDIGPTVIEMAGGDPRKAAQAEGLEGVSLFSPSPSKALTWWNGAVSLRTDRWRYTRYPDKGEELYDHNADPDEYDNLADRADYADIIDKLRKQV